MMCIYGIIIARLRTPAFSKAVDYIAAVGLHNLAIPDFFNSLLHKIAHRPFTETIRANAAITGGIDT